MKWEYFQLEIPNTFNPINALEEYGLLEWELIAIQNTSYINGNMCRFWLKRPLSECQKK